MNVKIKRQIQHLWFIKELLWKILTIAERCFSRKTSQPEICRIRVGEFYRSYSQPPSCDRIFCRNSCEMWSETIWRHIHKGIHIKKQLSRFIFNDAHFPKPGILFRSSECLKLLRRNHYKNIWRVEFVEKVMHIIQLSHVLQGEVVQVFFLFKHTHLLFSCKELTCLL